MPIAPTSVQSFAAIVPGGVPRGCSGVCDALGESRRTSVRFLPHGGRIEISCEPSAAIAPVNLSGTPPTLTPRTIRYTVLQSFARDRRPDERGERDAAGMDRRRPHGLRAGEPPAGRRP